MSYLFFDIDGTLVSHRTGLIRSAAEAIERARAKGHVCFIATGRHLHALKVIEGVAYDGIIYCNGAGIFYHDQIIETRPMPHDTVQKTLIQAEERDGAYTVMSSYISFKNEKEMKRTAEMVKHDPRYHSLADKLLAVGASDFEAYRREEILKIDIGFDSEEIMADFQKVMDPSLHLASMAGFHVEEGRKSGEITRKDVNKGTAIREAVAYLHGDMNDTYAFGDSGNDLEMLRMCHTGVAMGNGSDEVKREAQIVTDTVEHDGVYHAMEKLGLI
jgi:Cof subfamily protein (haloacid dehalogenase superfamily)